MVVIAILGDLLPAKTEDLTQKLPLRHNKILIAAYYLLNIMQAVLKNFERTTGEIFGLV